jgi:hypothetical protein
MNRLASNYHTNQGTDRWSIFMDELNRGLLEEVKWGIRAIVCTGVDWLGTSCGPV